MKAKDVTASVYHQCDDMGGGAAFCGNCNEVLGFNPLTQYTGTSCKRCGAELVDSHDVSAYSFGGSDF